MKRFLVGVLCLVLLAAALPVGTVFAQEPKAVTTLNVAQLQEKYPHGAYWNHTKGGNEDYTWTPCSHHNGNCTYNGSCGCNTYNNMAIQCMGFAYQLAYLAYGTDPRTQWTQVSRVSALDTLKGGDIIRYNGHSVFVLGVEGDTVLYADCNTDHRCIIQWNNVTTKATFRQGFTYVKVAPYTLPTQPVLKVTYHANGGTIPNTVKGYTYRVTSSNGLNMRKDAGTSYGRVTALPHGTTFTVEVGDTKEADGYTWGKTTYNGITGWLVISDYVEKTATVWNGPWYLEEQQVCRTAGGVVLSHAFQPEQPIEALCDVTEIGLLKEGYRFVGWGAEPDAPHEVWQTGERPIERFPALEQESVVVMLYAQWAPILPGDVDANGRVNNKDLGLLQRYLNEFEVTVQLQSADLNGDGAINNKDLGILQRHINEWDDV